MWTPFFLRGGTGVVFNNIITGTWSQLKISLNSRRDTETFSMCGLCDGSSPWDGNTVGESGYPCRDQPGRSTDQWLWTDTSQYPPQALDPVYGWNNKHDGGDLLFFVHNPGIVVHLLENRDYYNNTQRPDYTPFTYPHPLVAEQNDEEINDQEQENISTFRLFQNYPNPFNPKTAIKFLMIAANHVCLKIFDILGRETATLVNEEKPAGTYVIPWNGTNSAGLKVSSGVYFYQIKTKSGFVKTQKMILIN